VKLSIVIPGHAAVDSIGSTVSATVARLEAAIDHRPFSVTLVGVPIAPGASSPPAASRQAPPRPGRPAPAPADGA
jgi:hypothetical protein